MKAAFFDVDGTLTSERVWAGLMEYFKTQGTGKWAKLKFWAYHLPLVILYRMRIIPQTAMRKPWAAHLSWFFKGYSIKEAQAIWEYVAVDALGDKWREDMLQKLRNHKKGGYLVFLVSAGPREMIARIAQEVGADHAIGTRHEAKNDRFTGRASGLICIDGNKAILAKELISELGLEIDLAESYAYADSIGDVPLLEMVGHPVPTYPDKHLLPAALQRGWEIYPPGYENK